MGVLALLLILALAGCNQPQASEEVAPDPPASTPYSRALDHTKAAASALEQRSQEQQQQINGLQGGSP